jgi:hypothetical protein
MNAALAGFSSPELFGTDYPPIAANWSQESKEDEFGWNAGPPKRRNSIRWNISGAIGRNMSKDYQQLSHYGRQALSRMRRRKPLIAGFWKQAAWHL